MDGADALVASISILPHLSSSPGRKSWKPQWRSLVLYVLCSSSLLLRSSCTGLVAVPSDSGLCHLLAPLPGPLISQRATRLTPSPSSGHCSNITSLSTLFTIIAPSTSYPTFLFNFSLEVQNIIFKNVCYCITPIVSSHEGRDSCLCSLLYPLSLVRSRHSGMKAWMVVTIVLLPSCQMR